MELKLKKRISMLYVRKHKYLEKYDYVYAETVIEARISECRLLCDFANKYLLV